MLLAIIPLSRSRKPQFLQLAPESRKVRFDLLTPILPIKPHRRVIADEVFAPGVLDDTAPRLLVSPLTVSRRKHKDWLNDKQSECCTRMPMNHTPAGKNYRYFVR